MNEYITVMSLSLIDASSMRKEDVFIIGLCKMPWNFFLSQTVLIS